jgi:hypothetical protein
MTTTCLALLRMDSCDDVDVLLRRQDRVVVSTGLLALLIIRFLLAAFVILLRLSRGTPPGCPRGRSCRR